MQGYANLLEQELEPLDDVLSQFKVFVKPDPSLNAIRDNIRELVFYQNCLLQGISSQLPAEVDKMVLRTVRHIYLYLSSRLQQQGKLFS